MSEPRAKCPRVTPRNSISQGTAPDSETPYSNLRQLAGLIRKKPSTPLRRPQTATTPGPYRVTTRPPATISRTPASQRRDKTLREGPTTPHAIRAFERHRQAAATPRDRRRSGRLQRETPRDVLRPLSKLLSRNTQPIDPSPQIEPIKSTRLGENWVDEPDAPAPRLSIPVNELEHDDSFHMDPPRVSVQFEDDENVTSRSVEGSRRPLAEMGNSRLSRGSLGSLRASDQFGNLKNLVDITGIEESIEGEDENTGTITKFGLEDGDLTLNAGESTQEMQAFLKAASRRQSRFSDARAPELIGDEHDPTFLFALPEVQEERPLIEDSPIADDGEDNEPRASSDSELEDEGPQDYSDNEAPATVDNYSATDTTLAIAPNTEPAAKSKKAPRRREIKVSRHGTEYPSLPSGVIKRVASSSARGHGGSGAKINRETLSALSQATDWFFEQISEDLASYSEHAGRKTIDETDVVTLMRRQRLLNANTTPFSLAQKHLPRELLQSVRFGAPTKLKRRKRARLDTIREEEE